MATLNDPTQPTVDVRVPVPVPAGGMQRPRQPVQPQPQQPPTPRAIIFPWAPVRKGMTRMERVRALLRRAKMTRKT